MRIEPTVITKISPKIECLSLRNIASFARIDLSDVKKMIILKVNSCVVGTCVADVCGGCARRGEDPLVFLGIVVTNKHFSTACIALVHL